VTLAANTTSTIQSTTAGSGTIKISSPALIRNPGAFVNFFGINTDLGSASNQINFSPGWGRGADAVRSGRRRPGDRTGPHTTATGIQGTGSLLTYKSSLAEGPNRRLRAV